MYLTLETDYAVRIVGCLTDMGKRADAKYIAEQTGVTLRFALKILRKLVAADIIQSFKGIQGGYELAKSPAEISLNDVVMAIEGDYYISRCHDENFSCTNNMNGMNKSCCNYRRAYMRISKMVEKELSAYTFDKLIDKATSDCND